MEPPFSILREDAGHGDERKQMKTKAAKDFIISHRAVGMYFCYFVHGIFRCGFLNEYLKFELNSVLHAVIKELSIEIRNGSHFRKGTPGRHHILLDLGDMPAGVPAFRRAGLAVFLRVEVRSYAVLVIGDT